MFALVMAVGLYGVDAEVRQPEAFVLAGELGRFPPPAVIANNRRIAKEHLAWLENVRVMGPCAGIVGEDYLDRQKMVVRAYTHIEDARCYMNDWQQWGSGWNQFYSGLYPLRDPREDVLRAIESLRSLVGDADYNFGRLPAPMPCMESAHK